MRRYNVDALDTEPRSIDTMAKARTDIDDGVEDNDALVDLSVSGAQFAVCSDNGRTKLFNVESMAEVGTLTRNALPTRTVSFSPDGQWVALGNDENVAKIVNSSDILRTISLDGHGTAVKHVSYHPLGTAVATSSVDGTIRIFSLASEQAHVITQISGQVAKVNDSTDSKFTGVAWHPNGDIFAIATAYNSIALYSGSDYDHKQSLGVGQSFPISALEWSPDGRFLAIGNTNGEIAVWKVDTMDLDYTLVATWAAKGAISCIGWRPKDRGLAFSTTEGSMYVLSSELPQEITYRLPHGPKDKESVPNGADKEDTELDEERAVPAYRQDEDLEEELGHDVDLGAQESDIDAPLDDWIVDDDGAGYVEQNGVNKRPLHEHNGTAKDPKRIKTSSLATGPVCQAPFQSGATPWNHDRRYLCMNSIGYVWTVAQDAHNTVTVSFFDHSEHRDYRITDNEDPNFSMASLSSNACLLASEKKLLMHFHDGLLDNWEYEVSSDDSIQCISLSESIVLLCTRKGFVRTFNLYGTPLQVLRHSRDQVVSCASWKDYFIIIRSGFGNRLSYSIENAKTGHVSQKEDALDVAHTKKLRSVFFSDKGHACIVDSDGILLVLTKWNAPLQARWVPVLSLNALAAERDRKGIETYWPLGMEEYKFRCIVLKGAQRFPSIPLPMFSEFDLKVPGDTSAHEQEGQFLTKRVVLELTKDAVEREDEDEDMVTENELEVDKSLLHLLQLSCKANKMNKCLGIVELLSSEDAMEAASKIALRFDMNLLAEKINGLIANRAT